MKIIHCEGNKFLTYEALFRFMIYRNYQSVIIRIEENRVKSREMRVTYDYIKGIRLKEKYNVDEIIRKELEKCGIM